MQEFWSFGGVIALWLGISFGLWWLHRRSTHGRQKREVEQAVRAAGFAAKAPEVFDAIRIAPPLASPSADPAARLTAETHALLKRIQTHGAFFDQVNALRVQMQAAFGIDDCQPLSEILHLRRDLWAASEILLVEDLGGFAGSFAEEGSYERFREEAAALLFKTPGGAAGDDVIDLRLSLAREDAARFIVELKDAIAAARERDRLPTPSEIIAYPVAAMRAAPEKLRIAQRFISAFFAYSGDIARSIRDSDTMERGRRHLQSAREELPQRLSAGFERASAAARESAGSLRQHYDFLVAAHDFQARYERILHRAPELTERGRQFIARLDLAEKSERLRLTSANVLIWVARRLADILAHFIAGLQILGGALSRTTPWAFIEALFAPAPLKGRLTPAFSSYQMALAASGLREDRATLAVLPPPRTGGPAKAKAAAKRAAPPPPGEKDKPAKAVKGKAAAAVKSKAEVKPAKAAKARTAAAPPPVKAEPQPAPAPAVKPQPSPRKDAVRPAVAAKAKAASKPKEAAPLKPIPRVPKPAVADRPEPKPAAPAPSAPPLPLPVEAPQPVAAPAPPQPEKRRSFFARLLGPGDAAPAEAAPEPPPATPEPEPQPEPYPLDDTPVPDAAETKPTLLARLSELSADADAETQADAPAESAEPEIETADDADRASDEAGPLTLSLMELKSKDPQKPSPIRSFPWLRGN